MMDEKEVNNVGNFVINDLEQLRGSTTGRVHFENFKNLLRNRGIEYNHFEGSFAQVLTINDKNVYFTGGHTWWGFQKGVVSKMMNGQNECYLLIYADTNEAHYWRLGPIKGNALKNPEGKRWLVSETNGKKLNCPSDISMNPIRIEKQDECKLIDFLKGESDAI